MQGLVEQVEGQVGGAEDFALVRMLQLVAADGFAAGARAVGDDVAEGDGAAGGHEGMVGEVEAVIAEGRAAAAEGQARRPPEQTDGGVGGAPGLAEETQQEAGEFFGLCADGGCPIKFMPV